MPDTKFFKWTYPNETEDPYYEKIENFFARIDDEAFAMMNTAANVIIPPANLNWDNATNTLSWDTRFEVPLMSIGFSIYAEYGPDGASKSIVVPDGYRVTLVVPTTSNGNSSVLLGVVGGNLTLEHGLITIGYARGNQFFAKLNQKWISVNALEGDVTGTFSATVVETVGAKTAAQIAQSVMDTEGANSLNVLNALVKRDGSGNFSAGTITSHLTGNVTGNLTGNVSGNVTGSSSSFTGNLLGDVIGTQLATTVSKVGNKNAAAVVSAVDVVNSASSTNSPNQLVKRDSLGDFTARIVSANLIGNVNGSATGFTGALSGDVSGTQSATVVASVGGKTASQISQATGDVQSATSNNTASTLVKRDASGGFSADTIIANLFVGSVSGSVENFGGPLLGDVTGYQSATIISFIAGKTSSEIADATDVVQQATSSDTPSTLVMRDVSGGFSVGAISAIDLILSGDLTVNGTTTTINSQNLNVTDKNIIVNKDGNDVSSEGAGITVDRTTSKGSLIFKNSSGTKFAAGSIGLETDLVGTSTDQTLSNKKFSDSVTIAESVSTPATPDSGFGKIYFKNDNKLYMLNDLGIEQEVGSGGSIFTTTAGEALSAGNIVYISKGPSDSGRIAGAAYKLDPTNDGRVEFLGFVIASAAYGDDVRVQIGGQYTAPVGSGYTVGQPLYASVTTPGSVQQTLPSNVGNWIIRVGTCDGTNSVAINGSGGATAVKIDSADSPLVYTSVASLSTDTTLTNGNNVVLVNSSSANRTITLPAPTSGKIFHIKKTDSSLNTVTINTTSGTIDGSATRVLSYQYDSLTIVSDGSNFYLI